MKKRKRQLKVSGLYQKRRRGSVQVPLLRISGKWLNDAGVHPGDQVEISIVKESITIYKIKD